MQNDRSYKSDAVTDEELSKLIREGNQLAFSEFFRKYHKQVCLIATKYLKDKALTEDAAQEIFFKVWQNRQTINSDLSIRAYLFTITRNHLLNMLRNDKIVAKRIVEFTRQQAESMEEADEQLRLDETSAELARVLNSLPKKCRIIAKLKIYKGLNNLAIAQKFNLSVCTVKFQYYLALKELKKNSWLNTSILLLFILA